MAISERREILFCRDLLKFLEHKYPSANFHDNFKGRSRSEFYFSSNDDIWIVEAKSDIEAKSTPWKGSRFQDKRDAIRREFPNRNDSRYARWIIYLTQLNDYAERFEEVRDFKTMLGIPHNRLEDAKRGIEMLIEKKRLSGININLDYTPEICEELNVAYLSITKVDLSAFILSI